MLVGSVRSDIRDECHARDLLDAPYGTSDRDFWSRNRTCT